MPDIHPRYPVYIPSKGRADVCLTARCFEDGGVDYRLVVEPQEVETYAAIWPRERILPLPENDQGLVYSRNFIMDHAVASGAERHWQFDDDIYRLRRAYKGYRIPINPRVGISMIEDFVDRFENVGLASMNASMFVVMTRGHTQSQWPPFYVNSRCYTDFLIWNKLPNRFRGPYNEDTDMSLQVLSDGWCTLLFNVVLIDTPRTMIIGGGQEGVYSDDGRLKMAKDLERKWPGTVEVRRKFGRAQHHVKGLWEGFNHELKPKENPPPPRDYGDLKLRAVKEVQSPEMLAMLERSGADVDE